MKADCKIQARPGSIITVARYDFELFTDRPSRGSRGLHRS